MTGILITGLSLLAALQDVSWDQPTGAFAARQEAIRIEVQSRWGVPCDPVRRSDCTAAGIDAFDGRHCLTAQPDSPVETCMAGRRADREAAAAQTAAAALGPASAASTALSEDAAGRTCLDTNVRRRGEAWDACVARLVLPPEARAPEPSGARPSRTCRRESVRSEDGLSFRWSVNCTEVTYDDD